MKIAYKLFKKALEDAEHDLETHQGFRWTFGEWVQTDGRDGLCGPGWLHSYDHPLKAELYDPIHGQFGEDAVLFQVEVDGVELLENGRCKQGHTRMRVLADGEVERRLLTLDERTEIAIRAAAAANEIEL